MRQSGRYAARVSRYCDALSEIQGTKAVPVWPKDSAEGTLKWPAVKA